MPIAALGAGLVVGQHGAERLQFVVNLRNRHHKSVARHHRRGAPDGPRHLEDLRVQHQARIPPLSPWSKEVCTHGPRGGLDISRFGIFDDHLVLRFGRWERSPDRSHMGRDGFDRGKYQLLPLHREFSGRSGRQCGEKKLPSHFISPASFSLCPKAPHTARSTLRLFVRCGFAWDKARPTRQGRAGEKVTFLTFLGIFLCRS